MPAEPRHLRTVGPIEVGPGDARYEALRRGFNQRWIASPDYVVVAAGADDVVAALNTYLTGTADGAVPPRRITVRSGGHCYENFVCGDDVAVIIDVSTMDGVYYDAEMEAYCVEAGATNWHTVTQLYRRYGLTVPGGSCYSVGAGGHISGGGFGLLSRLHGLTVDHLYAVEVVTVRDRTHAEVTVARKDSPERALQDLWWAHTGGGGGNFGVVTRYWFRGLPEPPAQVLTRALAWDWGLFKADPQKFKDLVRRYGEFFEAEHTGEGGPDFLRDFDYRDLFTLLKLTNHTKGKVGLIIQLDGTRDDSIERLNRFLNWIAPEEVYPQTLFDLQMGEHPPLNDQYIPTRLSWLTATQNFNDSGPSRCGKYKSAYHTAHFTDRQLDVLFEHLTTEYKNEDALLQVDSYGGRINDVDPFDTAVPQRSSVLKLQYQTYWTWGKDANRDGAFDYQDALADPGIAAPHLAWIRGFYQDMYAETGGVPVMPTPELPEIPHTDGCYVNYPDVDLSDPEFNDPTEGQPWYQLYYGANYERLQRAKAYWDPRNVFRHTQSVRLPGTK
ncbi:isoquinoline biosynthesis protein [Streptomyces cellostaticus]|uniref:Isoquinoline biosynthesis protein n=1 Tax=Streptomyces cellostaticus TaxID=67285 RepID=A0A101NQW8_9ACTN|nr:BBE domain-containing protein [Streptomyces cellostaticus]KUM97574.1 isoquinoline biosynthesis protein [Streptomyces cellostaticus]GHI08158.1 FAD-linked oxidase [Streptomyces cellostaticus]